MLAAIAKVFFIYWEIVSAKIQDAITFHFTGRGSYQTRPVARDMDSGLLNVLHSLAFRCIPSARRFGFPIEFRSVPNTLIPSHFASRDRCKRDFSSGIEGLPMRVPIGSEGAHRRHVLTRAGYGIGVKEEQNERLPTTGARCAKLYTSVALEEWMDTRMSRNSSEILSIRLMLLRNKKLSTHP